MNEAQTVARPGETAEREESRPRSYNNSATNATPERMVVEKQLDWAVATLRNPRLRPNERACILLSAGQTLIGFLADSRGSK